MKKKLLIKYLVIGGAIIFGMSALHWGIMLGLHELRYWYTSEGVKYQAIVLGMEYLLLRKPIIRYLATIEELYEEVYGKESN